MRVHLIFNGVFAYVLKGNGIDVLVPFFAPHDYLLGCLPQLKPMPKGEITIQGLQGIVGTTPNPDFPTNQIPTIRGLSQSLPDNLHCVIHLPTYPSAMVPFRSHQNSGMVQGVPAPFPFAGLQGSAVRLSGLSGPLVMVYAAAESDAVTIAFNDTTLDFPHVVDPTGQALNLHFFAEGVHDLPDRTDPDRLFQAAVHFRDAWARLSSVVAGLDIQLGQLRPFVTAIGAFVPNDTGLPGLAPNELLDLDELAQVKADPATAVAAFGGPDSDCRSIQIALDNR